MWTSRAFSAIFAFANSTSPYTMSCSHDLDLGNTFSSSLLNQLKEQWSFTLILQAFPKLQCFLYFLSSRESLAAVFSDQSYLFAFP